MKRVLYALTAVLLLGTAADACHRHRGGGRRGSCSASSATTCGPSGCGSVQYGTPAWSATTEPSLRGGGGIGEALPVLTLEPPESFTGHSCQGGSCRPATRGRRQ